MVELDNSLLRLHLKHQKSSTTRITFFGIVEHVQMIDLGISDAFYYDFKGIKRVLKGQNRNSFSKTPFREENGQGNYRPYLAGNSNYRISIHLLLLLRNPLRADNLHNQNLLSLSNTEPNKICKRNENLKHQKRIRNAGEKCQK